MTVKAYYEAEIQDFIGDDDDRILGILTVGHHHSLEGQQRWAWLEQLKLLKRSLHNRPPGHLFLEFYIPRMGKRADALLVMDGIIFVIEFKIGAREHSPSALEQVEDYSLDLKNFHEGTHTLPVVPILISSEAPSHPLLPLTFAEVLCRRTGGNERQPIRRYNLRDRQHVPVSCDRPRRVDCHWLQADADDR